MPNSYPADLTQRNGFGVLVEVRDLRCDGGFQMLDGAEDFFSDGLARDERQEVGLLHLAATDRRYRPRSGQGLPGAARSAGAKATVASPQ